MIEGIVMRWQTIFIIGILVLSGCKHSSSSKKPDHIIQQNTEVMHLRPISEVKIKKTTIFIPKTLHPIEGSFSHTSYIGTPDHPTIDGGIINATDGTPVNHDEPPENTIKHALPQENRVKSVLVNSKGNIQKSFKDDWATSERVKRLLIAASSQGKLEYVLKKTDQMKLPASVAVVPMVESNYNRNAISPKGAGGAWQLMPSTAKDYGIKDHDRFEFNTSTDTALKLLNDLHQQFGNWELAFAAYNAGSKRVLDAMQKNPYAKSIDDLELPQETKSYVHKLNTLNSVFINLEKNYNNG
jgi:hypothetical protein